MDNQSRRFVLIVVKMLFERIAIPVIIVDQMNGNILALILKRTIHQV